MTNTSLTIGIVNWNTKEYLKNLLLQIIESPPKHKFEIIVVDNNSNDGSIALAEEISPKVTLIKNSTNIGFTRACNQILRIAKGNYITLLNTDIILQQKAIERTLDLMIKNPQIGIAGPKLINSDGTLQPSVQRFHNLFRVLLDEIPILHPMLERRRGKNLKRYPEDQDSYALVDYVAGAFFVIRKEVITDVGLFDEQYELYCQELDYAYRATQRGWVIAYYPYASAIHFRGESVAKLKWRRLFLLYYDRYVFLRKVYGENTGRLYLTVVFYMKLSQFLIMNFAKLVRPFRHDLRDELYAARETLTQLRHG